MTDQKINDLLKEVYESESYTVKSQSDFDSSENYYDYRSLLHVKMLKELDLVIQIIGGKVAVSDKGRRISENGGWLKHIEDTKIREAKESKILDLDLELKAFESRIGKKLVIFGFIVALLSFLITILTLEFWHPDDRQLPQKPQVEKKLLKKPKSTPVDSL